MPKKATTQANTRLAALRLGRGWSQAEAAHHAGAQLRAYQRWESGKSRVPVASWRLLCGAAGVPEDWRPDAAAEVAG